MKVVSVRSFRDRATELLRSAEPILVMRGGLPAGFWVPWDRSDLPDEVRRAIFVHLAEVIAEELKARGVTEEEVLADFDAARRSRR